jgi:hypothetical protein
VNRPVSIATRDHWGWNHNLLVDIADVPRVVSAVAHLHEARDMGAGRKRHSLVELLDIWALVGTVATGTLGDAIRDGGL